MKMLYNVPIFSIFSHAPHIWCKLSRQVWKAYYHAPLLFCLETRLDERNYPLHRCFCLTAFLHPMTSGLMQSYLQEDHY